MSSPSKNRGCDVRSFAGEDCVDLAAGFIDDRNRLLGLLAGTAAYHLHHRVGEVGRCLRQHLGPGAFTGAGRLPGGTAVGGRFGPAALGDRVCLTAVGFLGEDETFIREKLEGGVDRSRAGLPGTIAALLYLANDLVSVHRSFREEHQDARANVSTPHSGSDSPLELGVQVLDRLPQAEAWLVCAAHHWTFSQKHGGPPRALKR